MNPLQKSRNFILPSNNFKRFFWPKAARPDLPHRPYDLCLPGDPPLVMPGIEGVAEAVLCEHGKESITAIIRVQFPVAPLEHLVARLRQLE